jgi:hypothetical protein
MKTPQTAFQDFRKSRNDTYPASFGFTYRQAVVLADRSSAEKEQKFIALKSIIKKTFCCNYNGRNFNMSGNFERIHDGAFKVAIETQTIVNFVPG